jgi:SAM-dependent methyltransferase
LVYERLFERIRPHCRSGATLELGSGIGASKDLLPGVVTSDRVKTPYVDRAVSCYAVERSGLWTNIVAVDVLHHLCFPLRLFASAAEALESGGRLLLVEPAATPWGRVFYRLFHHEPIRLEEVRPPFAFAKNGADNRFANMAMAYALFVREEGELGSYLTPLGLRLRELVFFDLLAYPLSGGYSKPQLVPTGVLRWLLWAEALLPGTVLRVLALRMLLVLEKD